MGQPVVAYRVAANPSHHGSRNEGCADNEANLLKTIDVAAEIGGFPIKDVVGLLIGESSG